MLEKEENGECYVNLPMAANGREVMKKFKVVDVCKDFKEEVFYVNEPGNMEGDFDIFVSYEDYKNVGYEDRYYRMLTYSENVTQVLDNIQKLNLSFETTYYGKKSAYSDIMNNIHIKTVIVIALLFLLGINLYSCFNNALNERKFEIGVKRASGASKFEIIFQFFVEGLAVLLADILISVAVVITILTCVKWYMNFVNNESWIITINSYSVAIFMLCCLFLSLFFSILFAYMTTTVEIVKYLKNE